MKTHRILGVIWMALGGIPSIFFLWFLLAVVCKSRPSVLSALDFDLAVLFCLLALAGAIAGFPLYRGTRWARKFVGLVGAVSLLAAAVWFFAFGSLTSFLSAYCVLAIISLVLFFSPRHEPVA